MLKDFKKVNPVVYNLSEVRVSFKAAFEMLASKAQL
jgi:hypothetical protein